MPLAKAAPVDGMQSFKYTIVVTPGEGGPAVTVDPTVIIDDGHALRGTEGLLVETNAAAEKTKVLIDELFSALKELPPAAPSGLKSFPKE